MHTQEPWRVWDHDGDYTIEAMGKHGFFVDIANANFSEDDANRAVLCINACKGLTDEELYCDISDGGIKVALSELLDIARALMQQRDLLVHVLESIAEMSPQTQAAESRCLHLAITTATNTMRDIKEHI